MLMEIIPKSDHMADMRRTWSSFQAEVNEYQIAASNANILDMDYTRSLSHACLDRYLDAIGTAYAIELIKQQSNAS